jgi:methanogenic corrinoid protein MtbC1
MNAKNGGDRLSQAIAELQEGEVLQLVRARLEAGNEGLDILEACRQGMALVGERFQQGDYYISELVYAGAIFQQVSQMVRPRIASAACQVLGTVVMGTVKGDIHDIGKDLVISLLRAANFEVHDLGVDVAPARFVEGLRETGASVLALSALLTTSFPSMKATVRAVEEAGLRPWVRIMIGGGPTTAQVQSYCGADAWGATAQSAVELCRLWLGVGSGER